ncbi:MAG: hypothetical protein OQJ83_05140 [Altibacter sp.]|nr:hypothetical protein [Altibacter sp.]
MKKRISIMICILSLITCSAIAQNIYPTKIEGCNTERFGLENDSVSARKSNEALIKLITKNIDNDVLSDLRGVLKIQIIAYDDLTSCMISYENATNKSIKEINITGIKKTIDNELIWDSVDKVVSPMIEIYFLIDTVTARRMGFSGNHGLHELSN